MDGRKGFMEDGYRKEGWIRKKNDGWDEVVIGSRCFFN